MMAKLLVKVPEQSRKGLLIPLPPLQPGVRVHVPIRYVPLFLPLQIVILIRKKLTKTGKTKTGHDFIILRWVNNNLSTDMYNYNDIASELVAKAGIDKTDIFDYSYSPLQFIFEQYFQFCQTNLSEYSHEYNIQPARFFYREAYDINASATIKNDYYIIAVNKATLVKLYNLFYDQNTMFTDEPALLPCRELEKAINKDPFGILMFHIATLFTYYHEQGHLIQKSPLLKHGLYENYDMSAAAEPYSKQRHVLEFDADLNGGYHVCFHLIEYWDKLDKKLQTSDSLEKLLILGSASMLSYCMIFTTASLPFYLREYVHPHPVVRVTYIVDSFVKLVNINLPDGMQADSRRILKETFTMAGYFFTGTGGNNGLDKFLEDFQREENAIQDYVNELIAASKLDTSLVRHKTRFAKKSDSE
jgi:hypothetical protein